MTHPAFKAHDDARTFGERVADKTVASIGTWQFLIVQGCVIVLWVIGNGILLSRHPFDPYPFILLNLFLSIQAAVTGPLLLLAGNRQAVKDRQLAQFDYKVNQDALQKIIELHEGKAPPK